jgi:hypothetical protein
VCLKAEKTAFRTPPEGQKTGEIQKTRSKTISGRRISERRGGFFSALLKERYAKASSSAKQGMLSQLAVPSRADLECAFNLSMAIPNATITYVIVSPQGRTAMKVSPLFLSHARELPEDLYKQLVGRIIDGLFTQRWQGVMRYAQNGDIRSILKGLQQFEWLALAQRIAGSKNAVKVQKTLQCLAKYREKKADTQTGGGPLTGAQPILLGWDYGYICELAALLAPDGEILPETEYDPHKLAVFDLKWMIKGRTTESPRILVAYSGPMRIEDLFPGGPTMDEARAHWKARGLEAFFSLEMPNSGQTPC